MVLKRSLTPVAPGKVGRGSPASPSRLWMAVAETICAEDMAAILLITSFFTVWSFKDTHNREDLAPALLLLKIMLLVLTLYFLLCGDL